MKSLGAVLALFFIMLALARAEAHAFTTVLPSSPLVKQEHQGTRALPSNHLLLLRGGANDLDWRYFLAGSVCAASSHGLTTPIDVIKTRMQTNPEKYNQGVWKAAVDIVASEGLGFLLAGLGPTVVGYGLEGAVKFGLYETFKPIFGKLSRNQFLNFLLASVVAGGVASIVLCPMEEARIKMVGDASWAKENTVSAILRLVRENGLLASFAGLAAMLLKQVPYTMGKQVSFDFITTLLYGAVDKVASLKGKDVKWGISVASAFLASLLACLCSQPGDMVLTATYKGAGHGHGSSLSSDAPSGFSAIIRHIYAKHGVTGFFIGLQARLAHVASIITSQLVLYDLLKIALGLPVTGSH